jgi:Ni2+-binding GTPase involved in maturation of urease and hydrogenase
MNALIMTPTRKAVAAALVSVTKKGLADLFDLDSQTLVEVSRDMNRLFTEYMFEMEESKALEAFMEAVETTKAMYERGNDVRRVKAMKTLINKLWA